MLLLATSSTWQFDFRVTHKICHIYVVYGKHRSETRNKKKTFYELQMEQIKKRLSHWIDIVTPTTSEKVTFGPSNLIETSSNHNKGRKMIGMNVGKLLEIIKKARLS